MNRVLRSIRVPTPRSTKGFTLLEVMLAFVIFALSFATVLEIMGASMRSVRRAGADTEVALLAQSVMDLVGTEIPIEEGQYNGNSMDKYDWWLEIYLWDASTDDAGTVELAELSGIELYRIDLQIAWQSGVRERDMRFSTIKSVLADRR
jgi:general secretion pathway protein I